MSDRIRDQNERIASAIAKSHSKPKFAKPTTKEQSFY